MFLFLPPVPVSSQEGCICLDILSSGYYAGKLEARSVQIVFNSLTPLADNLMMTKSDKRACAVNRGPPARAATKSFRCDASSVAMLCSMLLFGTWKNNSIARLLLASVTQAEAGHRLSCRHAAFYTCFLHQEILDGMGSLDQLGRSQADGLQFPCSDQGGSGWASKYLECCVFRFQADRSLHQALRRRITSNHLGQKTRLHRGKISAVLHSIGAYSWPSVLAACILRYLRSDGKD